MRVGSDFSGVGAFNQALKRLGIDYEEVFACDMDKYARETFIHNYGEPKYYPKNVYDREIPKDPLDIYMTSPPCQAFSLAGNRKGKADKRGVLFFNSHEFIKVNKPRYFIFENVKGLLSDDNGKTFSEWVNMLGGKSVNGSPVLFPYEDSLPYHLYHRVLNAKKHGVPQNRERVFIIGIRDDQDNTFRFPKETYLEKKLVDILEPEVLTKHILSKKAVERIKRYAANKEIEIKDVPDFARCIVAGYHKMGFDNQYIKVESNLAKYYLSEKMIKYVLSGERIDAKPIDVKEPAPCVKVGGDVSCFDSVLVPKMVRTEEAKRKRRETGTHGFQERNLEFTKKDSMNTITTGLNKENWIADYRTDEGLRIRKDGNSPCLNASMNEPNEKMSRGNCVPFIKNDKKIRRLTPRECFRLMDFPDSFTWKCSDTQAYKQAGNSIVVKCLELIIDKFNL